MTHISIKHNNKELISTKNGEIYPNSLSQKELDIVIRKAYEVLCICGVNNIEGSNEDIL